MQELVRYTMTRLPVANNALAQAFTARRLKHHLTLRAVSEKIGVSLPTLHRLETADRQPSLRTLTAVAKWLSISLNEAVKMAGARSKRPREEAS